MPRLDLDHEIKIQNAVRDLIRRGLVRSAHDCSEGGIAVALTESCFNPDGLLGADVDLALTSDSPPNEQDRERAICATLFGESQSRILISVAPEDLTSARSALDERGVPHTHLGTVTDDDLRMRVNNESFRWSVADLYDCWWNSIGRAVQRDSAERVPSL